MANDVIGDIIKREGPPSNDPVDHGGPTAYGISQAANPDAWKNGPPTEAQARAIYESKYIKWPHFDQVTDPHLQAQLIDFGVNSGPGIAIQKLQAILGVGVDGVLGPQTLTALAAADPKVINNKLVVARVLMICKIVQKNPSPVKFILGGCDKALSFLR